MILQATNIQRYPNAGGLGYYAQLLLLSYISGLKAKGYYQLAAGYGTVGYEPEVDSFFGTPRSIKTGGVAFDIPLIHVTANQEGDAEKKRQFTLQVGTLSSALEHITPEQMFAPTDPNAPSSQQPDAISAVKALQKASAAGQNIYQINQANMNQVLPLLHHDRETLNEIKRALNVGKDITTHTDAVSIPGGWSGFGYIITDPVLGDGVYKISGELNGGFIDTLDELGMIGAGMSARETFSGLKPKSGGWSIFNAVTAFAGYFNTFSNLAKKCHPTIAASISGLLLVFNGLAGDVAVAVTGILIVSSPVFAIAFMIIMATLIHFVNELVTTITSGLCDGSLAFRRSYGVKREV